MTLAVYHQGFKNRKATEEAVKNFRKYNDGPYFLVSDGGEDFSDIAEKYNCHYHHSNWNLGLRDENHPSGIYGMEKDEVLEWLHRFYLACTVAESDHIMMMEDDVLVKGNIDIHDDVEFSGLYIPGNVMDQKMIDYLTEKYDAKFYNNWYGIPGGSIFKTKTFVENYDRITKIFDEEFDYIKKNLYGNIGWVDIWMTVYFYLCRKEYTVNPYFTETVSNPNWMDPKYLIVHHYKEHYKHFGYFYE
jgi:hypothetical protein